jgi:hypothetical protein
MRSSLKPSNHQGHEGHEVEKKSPLVSVVFKIFSPENIWALILFLIVIALIVFTTDSSPSWIYQGF